MRGGRIVAVIAAGLVAFMGFLLAAGGIGILLSHATQRDGEGFYTTRSRHIESKTAAIVANVDLGEPDADWWPLRTARITSESQRPVFLGIGPTDQVRSWLDGSEYDRLTGLSYGPFRTELQRSPGSRQLTAPGIQTFWVASVAGSGTQVLSWDTKPGDWTVILANVDGQPVVAADIAVAVQAELLTAGLVAAAVGLLILAAGIIAMVMAIRPLSGHPAAVGVDEGGSPVRLEARLDPGLSRWMWLVKWLLALPHVLLLVFLWLAATMLTIVAGFAILFTGRYPRSLFEFNVGVVRWTWRVSYYAFNVLGTDRYPPFSLHSDPDYPADFVVAYPQRLSRGLVLVKWWLLAIPHYIIVGIFTTGLVSYTDDGRSVGGYGLIGVLVVIAVVVLLFTGRYPRPLFDFILGLNRWCYRVLAYAMLLRDDYPPFRLDMGESART